MPKAHRILTASTGGVAALTLLASPASAAPISSHVSPLTHHSTPSAPAFHDRDQLSGLTVAEYRARLDAKLDQVAASLLTNRAQWDGFATTAVLTPEQRAAALTDLFWAVRTSRHLAEVPTTGPYAATAAEQTQIGALRASLGSLATQLRGLLGNDVDLTSALQGRLDSIAARTAEDRAQWDGVALSTVLSGDTRGAAFADLMAAKRAAGFLARVDRFDLGTAAQQATAAALSADVAALKTRLRTLLSNGEQPRAEHRSDRFDQAHSDQARSDQARSDQARSDQARSDQARIDQAGDADRSGFEHSGWDGHRSGERQDSHHG